MISKIRRLEVSKAAEMVAKEFASLPINPIAIAETKDILVKPWKPQKQGVSGYLMKQGDAFGIGYSEFIENEGFKNFTVGHELGHFFLDGHIEKLFSDGSVIHQSRSGFISTDPCEKEADLFSAGLLMPEPLFRKALKTSGEGFAAIEVLAMKCVTSITATAIRFAEFSDDPVAVIVSSGGRVDFCCLSPAIQEASSISWLMAGDLIPSGSATAIFQQVGDNIRSGKRQEASSNLGDWFDGAPHLEMNEDVVGLGSYGKTLTVLFTREAIEVEEDGEEDSSDRFRKRNR
jgi:Zn-dependent peptidase ImmA (M78 family)